MFRKCVVVIIGESRKLVKLIPEDELQRSRSLPLLTIPVPFSRLLPKA